MTDPLRFGEVTHELLASRLVAAGFAQERAEALTRPAVEVAAEMYDTAQFLRARPAYLFAVPGRIEVLGKHTDYAGGRSLLCATEEGFVAVAVGWPPGKVRHFDGPQQMLPLVSSVGPERDEADSWRRYPLTVWRRFVRNFPEAEGQPIVILASDLPLAAGMSSSSALLVAVALAIAAVYGLGADERWARLAASPERLAGYLACVENGQTFEDLEGDEGVGTHGGSEDHTAMLCARPGQLVQYRFAPVRFERAVALPQGYHFEVAASGVRAEKAGAVRERYNRAAELMRWWAELWRGRTGRTEATVGAALDAVPDAADRLRSMIQAEAIPAAVRDEMLARLEQFVAEDQEIIPAAGDALARGDLGAFGALVDRSQELAERLLDNQVPETVHLARSARELGAAAASAFGAGFGGSVWALVADAGAEQFRERWRAAYLERFPERAAEARFFATRAGPPARNISELTGEPS